MARVTAARAQETRAGILEAAKQALHKEGYAKLSTRGVAGLAAMPMSQIQYHFGSKQGMLLALFEYMNDQLLERQRVLFDDPALALSERWDRACDYLDDDLASGYVRILQELLAAGWSNPEIGKVVGDGLKGWFTVLTGLAREAEDRYGTLGPFSAEDVAALVGPAFIGAEAFLLLGLEDEGLPIRRALRRFGGVIRWMENQKSQGR